jgi:hypothetical protein
LSQLAISLAAHREGSTLLRYRVPADLAKARLAPADYAPREAWFMAHKGFAREQ